MSDSIVTKNILFWYDDSLIHVCDFFFTMRVRFGSKPFIWWSYGVRSWIDYLTIFFTYQSCKRWLFILYKKEYLTIFLLANLASYDFLFYIKEIEWSLLCLLIWCLNHYLCWLQLASFYLFVCVVSCYQHKSFSVCCY